MKKILIFYLVLLSLACHTVSGSEEELYLVTDAPVAVGNGIIGYYPAAGNGHVSIRYTYKGLDSDMILLKKTTYSDNDNSTFKELIKIPADLYRGKKNGIYS